MGKAIIFLFCFIGMVFSQSFSSNETTVIYNYPSLKSYFIRYYSDVNCLQQRNQLNFVCLENDCYLNVTDSISKDLYGQCINTCKTNLVGGNLCEKIYVPIAQSIIKSFGYLSTAGGIVKIEGKYLRADCRNMSRIYYSYQNSYKSLDILDDWTKVGYDPTIINIKFPPGHGSGELKFGDYQDMVPFSYSPLTISSIFGNSESISIVGDSFYTDSSLLSIQINDNAFSNSNILYTNHSKIIIKNQIINGGVFNISVSFDSHSSSINYIVNPIPTQILEPSISISKYNGGIITIKGIYLSSSKSENGNVTVQLVNTINNKRNKCAVISNQSTNELIICNLEKGEGECSLSVFVDGVENEKRNISFTYGVPKIDTNQVVTQVGVEFTVYGLNFGNMEDNSTTVLISVVSDPIIIKSISLDETKLTFILPYICDTTIDFSISVNGVVSNIHSIKPNSVYTISSSSPFTKTGSSIGITKFYSCKTNISDTYVLVDDSANQIPCSLNLSNNTAICNVGSGTGSHKIKVYVGGVLQIDSTFKYGAPVITAYEFKEVSVSNKTILNVTLLGYNFGNISDPSIFEFKLLKNSFYNVIVNDHESITFNVDSYFNDYIQLVVDSIPMENNYLLKLFKIGEIDKKKSNLSTRNGTLYITGTNLPVISSSMVSDDTAIIGITSYFISGPSNYKGFNISDNLITILLEDGIGRFNISLNINNVAIKYYSTSYSKAIITDATAKQIEENKEYELNITGINFGEPFGIIFDDTIDLSDNCTLVKPEYMYSCKIYSDLSQYKYYKDKNHTITLLLDDEGVSYTVNFDEISFSNRIYPLSIIMLIIIQLLYAILF